MTVETVRREGGETSSVKYVGLTNLTNVLPEMNSVQCKI